MPLTDEQRAYQRAYYLTNREKRLAASRERGAKRKAEKKIYDQERRVLKGEGLREYDRGRGPLLKRRILNMLSRARRRAKKAGLPFSITSADVLIPEFCPVLGARLEWHDKQGGAFNSPSLDRLIPELGYIPGNVMVISKRANCIKQDASAEEIRRVADWLERATALKK